MDIKKLRELTPWIEKKFGKVPIGCVGGYLGEKPIPPKTLVRAKYRTGFKSPKHKAEIR